MNWAFTNCRRYRRPLSLLADGALESAERAKVERHLRSCPRCREHFEELQRLVGEFEQLGVLLPEAEPSPALRQRWRAVIFGSSPPSDVRSRRAGTAAPASFGSPLGWSAWLTAPRVAWGSLALVWVLTLALRVASPDVAKPAVATDSPSLREVLLVLQSDAGSDPVKVSSRHQSPPPKERPQTYRRGGTEQNGSKEV